MGQKTRRRAGLGLTLLACGGPDEAARVELPVVADASGLVGVRTDLGYDVELVDARVMIENLAFMTAGEASAASLWNEVSKLLVPSAHAHPGHFEGGQVSGELQGRWQLRWLPGSVTELGAATLLSGSYQSASFTFAFAGADDGVAVDDPWLGHTALLRGRAAKAAASVEFTAAIDAHEARELVGAPFELEVSESSREQLGVRLLTQDLAEGETLFDGLDFAALDADGDGQVTIAPTSSEAALVEAYDLLRRTLQTHDHFDVRASVDD